MLLKVLWDNEPVGSIMTTITMQKNILLAVLACIIIILVGYVVLLKKPRPPVAVRDESVSVSDTNMPVSVSTNTVNAKIDKQTESPVSNNGVLSITPSSGFAGVPISISISGINNASINYVYFVGKNGRDIIKYDKYHPFDGYAVPGTVEPNDFMCSPSTDECIPPLIEIPAGVYDMYVLYVDAKGTQMVTNKVHFTVLSQASNAVSVGDADNGKTFSLALGQELVVRLTEFGSDGGYVFQDPAYDATILHLDTYYLVPPAEVPSEAVGASPVGVWIFTAIKKGSTNFAVSTARSWNKGDSALHYGVSLSVE